MASSVGGAGGGEVEGVRWGLDMAVRLGVGAGVRGLSSSESGSRILCRLVDDWVGLVVRVLAVGAAPLLSQGRVLAMVAAGQRCGAKQAWWIRDLSLI
jgi:hypothetical protein